MLQYKWPYPFKDKKKRKAFFLICIVILLIGIAIFQSNTPQIEDGTNIKIQIPYGSNAAQIAKILKDNDIIDSEFLFQIRTRFSKKEYVFRAGEHTVQKGMSFINLMKALTKQPNTVRITIPEGFTISQMAEKFVKSGLIASKDRFIDRVNEGEFNLTYLKDIPQRNPRLEGYLFPDTYDFSTTINEDQIIQMMLQNFERRVFKLLSNTQEDSNLSLDQIITLASIVEREAKLDVDRKPIAGVFLNRLEAKNKSLRKLQSCATVQYVFLERQGIIKEILSDDDIKVKSTYNTYLHEGLPPGPISSPGIKSIEATIFPEKHQYYYFVAKGDDSHAFSKTYQEHLQAIKKYSNNR